MDPKLQILTTILTQCGSILARLRIILAPFVSSARIDPQFEGTSPPPGVIADEDLPQKMRSSTQHDPPICCSMRTWIPGSFTYYSSLAYRSFASLRSERTTCCFKSTDSSIFLCMSCLTHQHQPVKMMTLPATPPDPSHLPDLPRPAQGSSWLTWRRHSVEHHGLCVPSW